MARNESEREDLINEATALLPRAEFLLPSLPEPLTVGFRDSAPSFFFGQNQVYHFDPCGRLRRAFVDGFLFRSQHSGLARLERTRSESQTTLLRTDLDTEQQQLFRQQMLAPLQIVHNHLTNGPLQTLRSVPAGTDWTNLLTTALNHILTADPWLSSTIFARR